MMIVSIARLSTGFGSPRLLACLLAAGLAGSIADPAMAIPACPEAADLAQPDGAKVRLHLRGDEYFSWHETPDGYAVVEDPADKVWKYAKPAAKGAKFQAIPGARVDKSDPAKLGLKKHAMPDGKALHDALDERHSSLHGGHTGAPDAAHDAAPEPDQPPPTQIDGPPPLNIPVSGTKTIKNTVILACFSDHWDSVNNTVLAANGRVATAEYSNLFNQIGHTNDGAVGSVRDYYNEVSYGKLTVDSTVTAWVKLPNTEAYYGAGNPDTKAKEMVADAIAAAAAAGFNFSAGDSDGDGWIDGLDIIHSGNGQEYSGNSSDCIWSHQGSMSAVVTQNGVKMLRYHTEPALRGWTATPATIGITRIGVICHEMGHFYGLPDLYDYSNTTSGLGNWCIMAGGSWNGNSGTRPCHFSAWPKCFLGFVNPQPIHSQTGISLPRVEDNASIKLLRDGMSNNEYYLIENRSNTGFDNDPARIFPGILISHVDAKSANNDLGTWAHPEVKIEEADGNNSIGAKTADSQAGDIWTSTSGLAGGFRDQTGNTNTNSMLYQSGQKYSRTDNAASYSYNTLSSFSAAGNPMTFNALTLKTAVASQTSNTANYTVSWPACTNATQYEIQEGSKSTLNSFADGAEDENSMYDNWHLAGPVKRDSGGAHAGSYSYSMLNGSSSVQSMTMRNPFKVTANTTISFYLWSHISQNNGYLKCQISNDSGNNWKTLFTTNNSSSINNSLTSITNATIIASGISQGDSCILRFVANIEYGLGWNTFPAFGYALDDISITNTEIAGYTGWATLSSAVAVPSYNITGKTTGVYAYRVRPYSNAVWQGYGTEGEVTVTTPAAPTIASLNLANASPSNSATVNWTLTFSSAVTGVNASNFSLSGPAATGSTVGTPTTANSGLTWNIPVATGATGGSLTLSMANATGQSPTVSTALPYAGQFYTMDKTAPTLTTRTIASNNTNSAWAKVGNMITLSLTASEAITAPTVTLAGRSAAVTGSGTSWSATITVTGSDPEGLAALNVSFSDVAGNTGTAVTTTTNSSSVTIDRTAPAIAISAPSSGTTKAGPVTYTVTYTDTNFSTSTLAAGNITLNKTGTANGTLGVSGSGNTRTVTISSITGDGTIGLSLAASTASDTAGNTAPAAGPSATFNVDNTAPTLTTRTIASNNTNSVLAKVGNVITLSLTASEAINTPTVTLAGRAAAVTGSGTSWSATITVTGTDTEGLAALNVSFSDLAGNSGTAVTTTTNSSSVTIDRTAPAIAISAPSSGTTKAGPVTYTVTYTDTNFSASTLVTGNITLNKTGTANGTLGVSGTGNTRTVTISSITGDGTLGVSIAAGTASDTAGNTALAAGPSATFSVDNTVPTLTVRTIASNNANSAWAKVGNMITLSLTASEAITAPTVTLAGRAATVSGSGTNWSASITVTGSDSEGAAALNVSFSDVAGNAGTAVTTTTNSSSVTIDRTVPAIAISAPSSGTTKAGPVTFTVTYMDTNFSTSTLAVGNITLNKTGTANGTLGVSGSGNTRTVTISSITGDGTIGLSLAASTASDTAGNTAPAAGPSATFNVDNTAPTLTTRTIASNNANSAWAKVGNVITLSLTASEAINTPTVTLAGRAATVSGSGTNWSAGITVTGSDTEGIAALNVSFSDLAGNTGTTATTTTNASSVTIDRTVPAIAISAPSASTTKAGPVTYTVTYTDTNFNASTLVVGNITFNKTGTANGTLGVSGAGNTRTVTISSITGDGTLGISIAAGTASDTAGNAAPTAGPSMTFSVDNTAPTVAVTPTGTSTSSSPITFTLTFSEPVTGLVASGVTVTNGTKGALSGSGTTYTIPVTPIALGAVTCQVNASAAQDAALNNNAVSNNASVSYVSAPTVTSISPASGTTQGGSSVTITGTNFTGASSVTIGGVAATNVNVVSATQITATTGAHASGNVDVVVTTPGGTATGSGLYTFMTGDLDVLNLNTAGSQVYATAVQPDGKTVIAGGFTSVLGVARSNIARLNADGTLDLSFDPKAGSHVYSVVVQPDGKILLGGLFGTLQPNGAATATARQRIARLNADGTLDTAFDPKADNYVNSLAVQADGKILVVGGFTSLQPNGAATSTGRQKIARLNADGTLDTGFDPNANSYVQSVVVQANGKILLGGNFTTLQPNGAVTATGRQKIARLNADGTLDSSFDPKAGGGDVNSMAVQADGKILLGGSFITLQPNGAATSTSRQFVARVNADGTLDTGFNPKASGGAINSVAVQTDGKVLLGGNFTSLQPNGAATATTRQRIARVNADGTLDPGFDPKANNQVFSVAMQSDGKILLGGTFTTLQPNGAASATTRNYFARLNNDAATQALSVPNSNRVEWLRGGASQEAASATFELSTDGGTVYSPLAAGTRISGGWELTGLSLPASGYLRARARTTGCYLNGSSGVVESVVAFGPAVAPTVTSITPASGTTLGGSSVTIFGANFNNVSSVTIGGVAATGVNVVNSTQITATTGAHAAGVVNVAVTTPAGTGTGNGLYTYVSPPTVTSIAPASGTMSGGTAVTITGTNFTGASSVTIGGVAATSINVVNSTQITATTGAHAAGVVNVAVTTPYGTGTGTNLYTYVAPPTVTGISPATGSTAGGTSVTITGTNFTGATAVTIGGTAATGVTVNSATSITATTPAHAAAVVSVAVTTPYGTGTGTNLYTFVVPPTVTGISPSMGSTAGGTSVTIAGTNFTGASSVTIGGVAATSVNVVSPTQITATTGAHAAGAVNVVVTTPGGTGTGSGIYTYESPNANGSTNSPTLTMMSGNRIGIAFQGIPGGSYEIQRSADLITWPYLTTVTAAPNGAVNFIDESPLPGKAFYRLRKP